MRDFKHPNQNSSNCTVEVFNHSLLWNMTCVPGRAQKKVTVFEAGAQLRAPVCSYSVKAMEEAVAQTTLPWCTPVTMLSEHSLSHSHYQTQATQIFKFLLLPPGSVIPKGK